LVRNPALPAINVTASPMGDFKEEPMEKKLIF
jgi:hypothetical protein